MGKLLLSIVVAASVASWLTACVTTDDNATMGRSVDGTRTVSTPLEDMKPRNFMLNIVDLEKLPPLDNVRAYRRTRDNNAVGQFIRYDSSRSILAVEHVSSGWFDSKQTRTFLILEKNQARAEESMKDHERRNIEWVESKKIYDFRSRGGWVHLAKIGTQQTTCIFGGVGFLSEGKGSPEIAVGENIYDTLIDLRDCSTERALKDYAEFFEGVKLVPAGYNRD